MKEILSKTIDVLDVNPKIIKVLKTYDIKFIYELCKLNRRNLKEYGLSQDEINKIIVKLQLLGLDLGKKYKL